MPKENKKLELFGILAQEPTIELRTLVQKLGVPLRQLSAWRTEYNKTTTQAKFDNFIEHADEAILEEAEDLVEQKLSTLVRDTATNELITLEEQQDIEAAKEAKAKAVEAAKVLKGGIVSLQALKEECQSAAGTLVNLIVDKASEDPDELTPKDIAALTSSLTNIQNAFFNKPTTNVTVNTQVNGAISSFREKMKS